MEDKPGKIVNQFCTIIQESAKQHIPRGKQTMC